MATVAIVTKRSVFLKAAPTCYRWSIVLLSYLAPFSSYLCFLFTMGFSYLGDNFTPFLGPGPQNYEFVARKPRKGTCNNGIAPFGCEKLALTSALRSVDKYEKKDNKNNKNKSIRNYDNLPGYFVPWWGPPNWASAMKLQEFRKVLR